MTALHSQLAHHAQPAVWRQKFPSEEQVNSFSKVKPIARDNGAMATRCVLEVYENKKSAMPTWTPMRKASTADTVSCLRGWSLCD